MHSGLSSSRFRGLRLIAPADWALVARHDGLEFSHELFRDEWQTKLHENSWREWAVRRFREFSCTGVLDRHLAFDFAVYLGDDLNTKVDVSSMAFSVEARAPLLDLDFIETCWSVRAIDRVRPWARKRIIRKLASRHLPKHLLIKTKQGFAPPLETMLRSRKVGARLSEALEAPHASIDEYVDFARVRNLAEANTSAGRYPSILYWRVLVLDSWARWVARSTDNATYDATGI